MPRATNSPAKRKRHKKWIKRASGYRGRRSTVFKLAKEATLKAGQYAYRDRRHRKNDLRKLWQIRINAAARQHNLSYSKFIHGLRKTNIELDRKVLAQIATKHPTIFQKVIKAACPKLDNKETEPVKKN